MYLVVHDFALPIRQVFLTTNVSINIFQEKLKTVLVLRFLTGKGVGGQSSCTPGMSPSKKQLIYLLFLYLIFAIYHLSVVSFLINSKLQRFSQFLKVTTLLCSQTIGLCLFSPVFLRSSRNFFTSGYQDFSQSLISLIIISMALDHITLLLWLS